MKPVLLVLVIIAFSNSCFGQLLNPKDQEILKRTKLISIYECNRDSPDCLDKKDVQIILSNKIEPCFKLKKKLNSTSTRRIISILLNSASFKQTDPNCFTSDFGMLLFDNQQNMTGSITTSLHCDNLSFDNRIVLTLSKIATRQIIEIIKSPTH
ncbi:hypothetical protein MgSA37_02353 [Mucilaginibacter gotjawali]|uniref:Uncharacterized protein n=2 Tax=Mucilaginibacter gotjawali TaxID=1550579 RepID=A0A0X8X218_9SPHI|nr:hypothetical protein [Mucilaginibacter gotjawali]BAU54181.1 hypothetical protein MgSA37_02353 [Mucilaginibacter gotjawali]